jgi:hypothetical protein
MGNRRGAKALRVLLKVLFTILVIGCLAQKVY